MSKKTNHSKPVAKERGTWLTLCLIYIFVHGLVFTYLTWSVIKPKDTDSPIVLLWILLLLSVADVVSAIAIWFWKKWGYQLFIATTLVSIVVGLLATASQLWVFYAIIPLAVLGYLLKDKQKYMD